MGYAFTFYIVSVLGQIPVGAYVHYPTISTDMLARVKSRQRWHTNSGAISSSSVLSQGKLLCVNLFPQLSQRPQLEQTRYYRLFMYYYSLSLRSASFLMVNSSWTKNHIDDILRHSDRLLDAIHFLPIFFFSRLIKFNIIRGKAQIVYPPCDTREMAKFPLENRERIILSVAQFRCVMTCHRNGSS